jgi:hypothetical protein
MFTQSSRFRSGHNEEVVFPETLWAEELLLGVAENTVGGETTWRSDFFAGMRCP